MMATVPHVTSVSGLRKFQADGFLFDRVYYSGVVWMDLGRYKKFQLLRRYPVRGTVMESGTGPLQFVRFINVY